MVLMVSGLAEVRAAKAMLEKAMAELTAEGKSFLADVEFGIMVEVPSDALLADRLAKEKDLTLSDDGEVVQACKECLSELGVRY